MTKHTPGPWSLTEGRVWVCTVGNNPDDPAVWSTVDVEDGKPFPFGDKRADARLIAAAPELLDALKTCRNWLEQNSSQEDWMREIYDAIAKAEGEAQ